MCLGKQYYFCETSARLLRVQQSMQAVKASIPFAKMTSNSLANGDGDLQRECAKSICMETKHQQLVFRFMLFALVSSGLYMNGVYLKLR